MKKNRHRLLIISSCANLNKGGQPISVLNIAIHLAKAGVQVYMITAIERDHMAYRTLRAHGVKVYTIPMRDNMFLAPVFGIFALFKGIPVVRKNRIRLIQTHAPSSAFLAFILKILTGSKTILVTHGIWLHEKTGSGKRKLLYFLLERMERLIYRNTDAFISPVNHEVYTPHLIKTCAKKERIYETNFGPPVYKFICREENGHKPLPGAEYGKRIVFIGKIDEFKGQEILIRAAPKIIESQPTAGIIFVGDGPDLHKCKSLVKELGISNNVIFTGSRSDTDRFLKSADAVVSHISPIEMFGLGTAHREAVFHKAPLVSKEDPIQRKYFGDSIYYVDPNSIDNVSDTLIAMLNNPAEAKRKAERAHELLTEKFSWSNYARTNLIIYARLMRKH